MKVLRTLLMLVVATAVFGAACATSSKDKTGVRRVPPNEPWRSTRPVAGPLPDFKLPVFQRAELKNGMTLFVVEDHALPTVNAGLVIRSGSASETAKEAGLSQLAWDLLDEGAGSLSNLQIATELEKIGTRIHVEPGREYGVIALPLLKKHADAGLELLATVAKKPTFTQGDFDRVKAQHIATIQQREGDPSAVAATVMDVVQYGNDHPYGHDTLGTTATLEKLNRARVQKYWADNAGPKNAALVLAGDVTLDEAKAMAEKHFGKWTGTAKPGKPPADPKVRTAIKLVLVDVPGAPQSVVIVGRPGIAAGDPDEASATVMNEVFGGTFSSRLNLKLREEKQWTYGAFSVVAPMLGKGPFYAASDVQTANTADAVVEILAQLEGMKTNAVTDEELARAKDGWVKSLPGVLGLPERQVFAMARVFASGLGPDFFERKLEGVKAVKADDVKKAAERLVVKEDLVVVVVGDRANVEAKLKEKALGDIAIYTRDGVEAK